ncbi:MAG: hypothetical protein N4A45_05115 [Flavobacteriales bacterium]|nr:hypothetical protein [Flavobacteriales bacterium]
MNRINYKALYLDFLNDKAIDIPSPIRASLIKSINTIEKGEISLKQIRELNEIIKKSIKPKSSNSGIKVQNSYDKDFIKYILENQKEYGYSNREVANIYKMSRNTIANWKRIFQEGY